MTPSEVLDDETAQHQRDFTRSSAAYYLGMRDININAVPVTYFEQTVSVTDHGYAHLFGWALGGE